MRKFALGLVGAAMLIASPLAAPASAAPAQVSATEIWKCWTTRTGTETIPREQYWSCVGGVVQRISTADGSLIAKYDGNCANGVWQRNRNATWVDMILYCPSDGRPRS
ncbi:hypothetical protein ABT336_16795 [Micromonospora sp. NPDC000207]|uniref:hypothetical protein n=1 Tax=Micromonospora sp. NPDC000207 TaxID=3154246 RepID=UPI003324FFE6